MLIMLTVIWQRRVLVELVDDHVRVGVALQVDHDPALRARGRSGR